MKQLLKSLHQRPIAYYPLYRQITGSTTAGILLSQLMYWFSKKEMFHKTDNDIMSETLLTKKELENAKKLIKKLDFINVARKGIPAKTYYEIDWEKYETCLLEITSQALKEEEKQDSPNGGNCTPPNQEDKIPPLGKSNIIETKETTTETTTKTLPSFPSQVLAPVPFGQRAGAYVDSVSEYIWTLRRSLCGHLKVSTGA